MTVTQGRRNRIHDFDPWVNLLIGAWLLGVGCFNLGAGWSKHDYLGFVEIAPAIAFGALFVWGIQWRWKSDIEWNLRHADTWVDVYMTGREEK